VSRRIRRGARMHQFLRKMNAAMTPEPFERCYWTLVSGRGRRHQRLMDGPALRRDDDCLALLLITRVQ
jgi:hypothetical protein